MFSIDKFNCDDLLAVAKISLSVFLAKPVLGLINPELGLGAMALCAGAGQVSGLTKQIKGAKQGAVDAFQNKKSNVIVNFIINIYYFPIRLLAFAT